MHLVRDRLSVYDLATTMGGCLSSNHHEQQLIGKYCILGWPKGDKPIFDMSRYIETAFEMDKKAGGTWDKENWYCESCIYTFARSCFMKWWAAQKMACRLISSVSVLACINLLLT